MTNFEKYKKQIPELIYNTKDPSLAVVGSKVINCRDARCSECEFSKRWRLTLKFQLVMMAMIGTKGTLQGMKKV